MSLVALGGVLHGTQGSHLNLQSTVLQATTEETVQLNATHYGIGYDGSPLGCAGAGYYSSDDSSIAAVGPTYYSVWSCGTRLLVEGPDGRSLVVIRKDSCPGCGAELIDLSEAGILTVCGSYNSCQVKVTKISD